jgi:hypothetical protein
MNVIPSSRALAMALVALLLPCMPVASQQPPNRYDVEIVIFRISANSGTENLDAPTQPGASSGGMQLTPTTQRRLGGEVSRLRAAGGFQVLAHTAWTQAPAALNSRRGVSTAQIGIEAAGVSGNVFIERGQYLHLGFDLRIEHGGRVYAISDQRRVRAGDAQYFDHPAIGILALISPAG